jgi:hypothetical protein
VANRVKDNRAEQKNAPNMKLVEPAQGGIHSAVHAAPAGNGAQQEAQPGAQAGQNPRT